MSPQDNDTKDTTGSRRRSSAALATMGNFDNEPVDRSAETAVSRKQKRANRRSTLRMQSEVAPFLGMCLDDEEDEVKERKKADEKEKEKEKEKEEKKDEENEEKVYEENEAEKEK
ncbi:hypothetical protein FMUND_3346 [Fusarium mundagurra]|uniref:Uncharacterized protein n=1 Tax=Fusarium mundagurra TaxID=1567541 RepID=A0A8H5Z2I9_9HYPO|nr:hypothetical protein FMUND_3346 [Fusarium mundagurra]